MEGLAAQHPMALRRPHLAPDLACSSDPTPALAPLPLHPDSSPKPNSNPNPSLTSNQIPPGLAGSESENSYTNRMGMSKDYKN